jgi:NDP-sugar pyrophosphorylase family protein
MKIVIPMAGRGSRFAQVGYTMPKPLIDVHGKAMIHRVVENIGLSGHYIFLVLKEHYNKYCLQYLLPLICGNNKCDIIVVDQVTEGAACTVLLSKDFINNDEELLIANSDQLLDWSPLHFINYMITKNADGGIVTFLASHPKWSFAKVEESTGLITEVAEKNPISNHATAGIYYFKQGCMFVKSAEQMISKDIRVNGEFYVCPIFNELINDSYNIYNYPVPQIHGIGTPEDLERYLNL